jgi:DNA-binding LytR/AlgR family response regulator
MAGEIKCVVIDDEAPALRLMQQFIAREEGLSLVECFKSPVTAMNFIMANSIDLIFCDIQMPEMNGINLIRSLKTKPVVIFTTAFSEFAADAFEVDAADYLRKPFSFERFSKAVFKAKEYLRLRNTDTESLPVIAAAAKEKNFLTVKSDHKILKLYFDEILFVEAFQEYVKIITEKERIITFERLKNIEALLPSAQFMRIHRSYIICKSRVKAISGNLLEIGDHQVPVSRELKEQVIKELF